jgi:LysM repeat protein
MPCTTFFKLSRKQSGCCILIALLAFSALPLAAAPNSQQQRRYYVDENAIALKELRDAVDDVRHEMNNHETEIRVFDEKLQNFDSIIDGVRDQVSELGRVQKEQLKSSSANLEAKISSLETVDKGIIADLKQFKNHANDTAAVLAQYKQKIADLEKIIDQQNQNIDHLQAAMRSLVDVLQVKDGSSKSSFEATPSGHTYKVKAGDSLEKIARAHQTTVQALKELNGLANDRIIAGKVLQIPEK